jgi:hypothetical protein
MSQSAIFPFVSSNWSQWSLNLHGKVNTLPAAVKGLSQTMLNDFERRWQCPEGWSFIVFRQGNRNTMVEVYQIYFIVNLLHTWFKFMGLNLWDSDSQKIKKKGIERMKECMEKYQVDSKQSLVSHKR